MRAYIWVIEYKTNGNWIRCGGFGGCSVAAYNTKLEAQQAKNNRKMLVGNRSHKYRVRKYNANWN